MSFRRFMIIIMILLSLPFFSCQKRTQKIWLHKANDIEDAQHFQHEYAGLEIDITYIDSLQTFLILHGGGHFEPNPVTFEKWIYEIDNIKNLGLWLDFKNLDENNAKASLDEMNRLYSEYKLQKNNTIVESKKAAYLKDFQKAGFKVSYYIPDFKPNSVSQSELQEYTDKIKIMTSENNMITISGYYYQYQYMRDSFPDLDLLLWYNKYNKIVKNKYIRIANNDDKVKILLVKD